MSESGARNRENMALVASSPDQYGSIPTTPVSRKSSSVTEVDGRLEYEPLGEEDGAPEGGVTRASGAMTQLDATLFIVGELAGAGLLALSEALTNTGVVGILLIVLCACAAAYTGNLLGRTWVYLEGRDAGLMGTAVRQPYAEMGRRTFGAWMGRVILVLMNVTLFGTSVVLLLVSADLIRTLCDDSLDICSWVLLLAVLLTPVTWLGSPKHLRAPAMFALVSVVVAAFLMLVQMLWLPPTLPARVPLAPPSLPSFCLGLSTIMFSFTGVSTFPTIQMDMADRAKFSKAAAAGFAGLCLVYVPVATMGYAVYGDAVYTNITRNFSEGPLLTVILVLLIVHFLGAFVMLINPVCQNVEGALNIQTEGISRHRVVIRSSLILLALMVAETVPSFGKIMHLIGGSFTLMLTFIIPSLLYIRLRGEYSGSSKHGYKKYVMKRLYLTILMVLCVALSVVVVFYSINEIFAPGTFQVPCYLRPLYNNRGPPDITPAPFNITDAATNVTDAPTITSLSAARATSVGNVTV